MPQSIIIEVSNNNAINQQSNGEFECNITPTTINNGDAINVKMSVLDTTVQNSEQINITEEYNIIGSVIFYDVNFDGYDDSPRTFFPPYGDELLNDGGYYFACEAIDTVSTNLRFFQKNFYFTVPKGIYTPTYLSAYLTQKFSQLNTSKDVSGGDPSPFQLSFNNGQASLDPSQIAPYIFYNPLKLNGDEVAAYQYQDDFTYYVFGCSNIVVGYDTNNSNKFSFDYLHTPIYDQSGNQVVIRNEGGENATIENNYTSFYGARTGIIFTELKSEPEGFFQILGFSKLQINNMIAKVETVPFGQFFCDIITNLDVVLNRGITSNYISLTDLVPYVAPSSGITGLVNCITLATPINLFPPVIKASDIPNGIYADNLYFTSSLTPYFIIELSCINNDFNINQQNINHLISSVVSKFYTSENYISSYEYDSIPYIHSGDSLIISNIRCRILDANTKQVSTELGPNNTVLVQILKQ